MCWSALPAERRQTRKACGIDYAVVDVRDPIYLENSIDSSKDAKLQERHLGLVPTRELGHNSINNIIENAKKVSKDIDIEKVVEIGHNNKENANEQYAHYHKNIKKEPNEKKIKISIALDKSFNFYYKDNLEILQKKARIEFFSPIENNIIPADSKGIIIGGGFPEIIADALEKNSSMKKNIMKLAQDNIPIYAECGGLM